MRKLIYLLFLITYSSASFSQDKLIINTLNRETTSLNGQWKYIIDPYQNGFYNYRYQPLDQQEGDEYLKGYYADNKASRKSDLVEYNFDEADEIYVPGDWNSQDDKLLYYEGTIWYRKKFNIQPVEGKRYYLYFGAVNYEADVYLNSQKLGNHVGGFTPFNFEITNLLKEENSLVLKVDNTRHPEAVPTVNTDWWNYGGITRDVKIVEVNETFIRDYQVQLDPNDHNVIKGFIQLEGDVIERSGVINIPELKLKHTYKVDRNGRALIEIRNVKPELWSTDNPKLYTVNLSYGSDLVQDQIGFRSIRTEGSEILLNGKPIFLRGICIHEEFPMKGGRITTPDEASVLLNWVEDMNGNFARLAHYPHNEYMSRLADEMGILLWEEIPVYWTIDWNNPETYANAENQLSELINRDKNRASVIIWSMANETPVKPERTEFLKNLANKARSMDNTRLISAAMERHRDEENPKRNIVNDPAADFFDIVSFNQYEGWYTGLPNDLADRTFEITYDKPVIVSEFGGGALYGYRGDTLTRWTEDFQAALYRESLEMLEKIDNLSGLTPWLLADFRSPRRPLANIQDGYNRKGVISEHGQKKEAFYVLQKYYDQISTKEEITGEAIGPHQMHQKGKEVND